MAKLTRGSDLMGERYKYDFRTCTPAKGWAQLDTRQDAPYYGTWVNPFSLEIFNYCEGDLFHTQGEGVADFIQALTETIDWNKNAGYWLGIDPMGRDEIRSAFVVLGFRDALH